MQKYKAKKDVVEQVTSKLQASKDIFSREDDCEVIEKAQKGRKEKYPIGYVNESNHTIKVSKTEWKPVPQSKYQIGTLNTERRKIAPQLPLITDTEIKQVKINASNYMVEGQKYYYEIQKIFHDVTRGHCKAIENKKVVLNSLSQIHFYNHDINECIQRTKLLPYVPEIVEKYGVYFDHRVKNHKLEQEIIGKAKIDGKEVVISVCFISKGDLLFLSVFDTELKKSFIRGASDIISHSGVTGLYTAFTPCDKVFSLKGCSKYILPNSQNMSSKIKPDYDGHNVLHKSFDITVTDITENNKQKKLEQLEKSLNAMYTNTPFVIKHIKADKESKNYGNITLRIRNFDKNKIEKAVHSLALTLDTKVGAAKGEAFTFKAQEELTNRFVNELTEKTKAVYNFVISYFGLPEITVVSKANLTYKGKIIYNSETGEPIQEKDWKKFVEVLEQFLNRNYNGVGERIVLSSEALGRILARLSETNSLEKIKKKTLSELSINHRNFDWISQSSKNMADVLDGSVDRWQAARIEMATHSAAIKVTKVTDNMRNDIQDIIINGIINRQSKAQVSQNLFDKCVGLNRDFQRIADTEIQNNTNNAYLKEEVYNTKEGEKVYFKRYEMLDDNTCKKCKKIKGEIALWSDTALPDEHIKDEYAKYAIWEGKESGDMPAGILHPYCRGSWFRYYPELD